MPPLRRPTIAIALLAVALLGAACSGDDGAEPKATSTTAASEVAGDAYSDPGPYPVGVTTLTLPAGPKVEVWYPAAEAGGGKVSYDTRDFVPESIKALLTTDIPAGYTFDGDRDVAAAKGPFGVVLFSHGFSGFRLQSSFLTSHLASQGFIVAAPDHAGRDLVHVLSGGGSGDQAAASDELVATLDLVLAENDDPQSLLAGHVDGDHVAALGHSAGGGTIVQATAADDRIDGYISMASGLGGGDSGTVLTPPDRPSFFLAGALDGIVSPTEVTHAAFEAAPSPSTYWEIALTGHNGFDDFCTFGNGTGIIGVARASGLGAVLDSQPQLVKLGEDGCVPPAAPVEDAYPIIRHGVTAWLRALFGIDPSPQGMSAEALQVHDLDVTVEEK